MKPSIVAAAPGSTLVAHRDAVRSGARHRDLDAPGARSGRVRACTKAFIRMFDTSARASAAALQVDAPRRRGHRCFGGRAGLGEGPVRRGRASDHRRLRDAARRADRRCRRPAVARVRAGRRRAGGPHQHERVRVLGRRHQPAFRHAGEPDRPRRSTAAAITGRVDLRWRRVGGQRRGAGRRWARTPAARSASRPRLQGLVGFKNTQRLTPLRRRVAAVDHARHRVRDHARRDATRC